MRFVAFTLNIFAGLAVGSVFVFRARGMQSAYRTFGYPVTPILFIGLNVWIMYAQIDANPKESLIVAVLLGVGGALYWSLAGGKPPRPNENDPVDDASLPQARVVSRD